MVVRVEPRKEAISSESKGSLNRRANVLIALCGACENRKSGYIPFLHFASRNVNAIGLTATAHGEVDIERGEVVTSVALGDGVECRRVVENMVVERELAADSAYWSVYGDRRGGHRRIPRDEVNTTLLEAGPAGLTNIGSRLNELIGRDLAGPVGLDGLLHLTVTTCSSDEMRKNFEQDF